jgi:hypothetical protein
MSYVEPEEARIDLDLQENLSNLVSEIGMEKAILIVQKVNYADRKLREQNGVGVRDYYTYAMGVRKRLESSDVVPIPKRLAWEFYKILDRELHPDKKSESGLL